MVIDRDLNMLFKLIDLNEFCLINWLIDLIKLCSLD